MEKITTYIVENKTVIARKATKETGLPCGHLFSQLAKTRILLRVGSTRSGVEYVYNEEASPEKLDSQVKKVLGWESSYTRGKAAKKGKEGKEGKEKEENTLEDRLIRDIGELIADNRRLRQQLSAIKLAIKG